MTILQWFRDRKIAKQKSAELSRVTRGYIERMNIFRQDESFLMSDIRKAKAYGDKNKVKTLESDLRTLELQQARASGRYLNDFEKLKGK